MRRTSTDTVYEKLHEDIVALRLLPGTKLSETDVASQFGVSRQPVRNAFTRLGNEDLLLIRPQKATVVRGFSMERISVARLVRLAVELEVVYRAMQIWTPECTAQLENSIAQQERALSDGDVSAFHDLDFDFHKLIYDLSECPLAFDVTTDCKQKIDRLCVLSLGKNSELESILADHRAIITGLASGDLVKAQAAVRQHLSRLDDTIAFLHKTHPHYFE